MIIEQLKVGDLIDFIYKGSRHSGEIIGINADFTIFYLIDCCGFHITATYKDLRPSSYC